MKVICEVKYKVMKYTDSADSRGPGSTVCIGTFENEEDAIACLQEHKKYENAWIRYYMDAEYQEIRPYKEKYY